MRMTRLSWSGVAMIAAGLALFGGWVLWSETRSWRPVDMVISLSKGHIRTPEFKTNLGTLYTIQIEVMKNQPFDTLSCLLGLRGTTREECMNTRSVIHMSWVLRSQGVVVARGSAAEESGGIWMNDAIAKLIGSFVSEKGRRYTLDVDVLADGSPLAVGNPRLIVGVHPSAYEGNAFVGVQCMLIAAVFVLVGAIVLIASLLRERRCARELVRVPSVPSE